MTVRAAITSVKMLREVRLELVMLKRAVNAGRTLPKHYVSRLNDIIKMIDGVKDGQDNTDRPSPSH